MKIGFIGLGNMGNPMARNLVKAGHEVVAFDVFSDAIAKVVATGAKAAASVAEAVKNCEVVITMLPSSPQVREVYTGAGQLIASVSPGTLLIDSSTIDPHTAREVAAIAGKRNIVMLDAPVSGGTVGAEAATLTFMVGGDENAFVVAKPILEKMGKNVVHCGAPGTGQVAKICNNMLLAISMIGVSEAMNLGATLGIDPKLLAGIINTSSGRCWSSDTYNPFPGVIKTSAASRGYTGGFGVDLMLKDLGLAMDAAKQTKQAAIMGSLAHQLYQTWSAMGSGGKDFSSIINLYKHD
jgi:3-hydroxyisobutyrate dehydrogenase